MYICNTVIVYYVLVIARAWGIYAIYCTEARGRFAPEGWVQYVILRMRLIAYVT